VNYLKQAVQVARLEVIVPITTKQQILQQAAQARKPMKLYCGELLSRRTQSFAEIANSYLEINLKLDAIIGTLCAIERIMVSEKI
jgi:hypothetical protein